MSKFGAGVGAPGKEERLQGAAAIHIRLGNKQRYCELMVEMGKVWVLLRHSLDIDSKLFCFLSFETISSF